MPDGHPTLQLNTLTAVNLGFHRAPRRREWMDATSQHFANRCLPMQLANESGWELTSLHDFLVQWDGGAGLGSLQVDVTGGPGLCPATSHFGHGILTWTVPWLFRTSPGWDLLVRGPANLPRDGVAYLEGVVETDWSPATFTVNWKLTRPGTCFVHAGDPVAMVVPQRRLDLERVEVTEASVTDDPELARAHRDWSISRTTFLAAQKAREPWAVEKRWEADYYRGLGCPEGTHVLRRGLQDAPHGQGPEEP